MRLQAKVEVLHLLQKQKYFVVHPLFHLHLTEK